MLVSIMTNLGIAKEIATQTVAEFGKRINSILLYGSSLSARRKPNDLDIVIVFNDHVSANDLSYFRTLRSTYNIIIDLQVISLPEVNPRTFSHDTHGEFFLKFLHQARPVYGTNPFIAMHPLYQNEVISVIQKAQYYYYRAKNIQTNAPFFEDAAILAFHRKKILLMLIDFWIVYAGIVISSPSRDEIIVISSALIGEKMDDSSLQYLTDESFVLSWEDIFMLYQKCYEAILKRLQFTATQTSVQVGQLYVEMSSIGSKKLVIVASGCPSDYNEDELIMYCHVRGYDTLHFHYTATGKSSGADFRNPTDDLADVIAYGAKIYHTCLVFGNSYGGYATLSLSKKTLTSVQAVLIVSPAFNLNTVKSIETLPEYLTREHSGWYRFPQKSFEEFLKQATLAIPEAPKKTALIHGSDDAQIPISEIRTYAKKYSIPLIVAKAGHLSFRRLVRENIDALHSALYIIEG